MNYVFLTVSIVALVILLLGSYFHRMVGVELINTLQVIYYLHFTLEKYSEGMSSIQCLSLVGLNTLFW